MSDTDTDDDSEASSSRLPDTSGDGWKTITGLKVVQGRITVRMVDRERYGIADVGDILDVVVHPPDGESLYFEEARVGAKHRILLPSHRVEMHDLEEEVVDVEVRDTGKRVGGGA